MVDTLNPALYYRTTDLPPAAAITGEEVVEAVQGGKNVKFTLSQLMTAGKSAYAVAVENGYTGTQTQWLASLVGNNAYQVAVLAGFVGTQAQWLTSLIGAKGTDGTNGKDGTNGIDGTNGTNGKSAYELAVVAGYTGDQATWLLSLIGKDGVDGVHGKNAYTQAVEAGFDGTELEWLASLIGKSAYGVAVQEGFVGTVGEWLVSLVGKDGTNGKSAFDLAVESGFESDNAAWLASLIGADGVDGKDGNSAYTMAAAAGFEGTEAEWLASLVGHSAYEVAVENGFDGTEAEWLLSLVGKDGTNGTDGEDGKSAYELAVAAGFLGNEESWLATLKGPQGEDGTNGTNGRDGTNGIDGKSAYRQAVETNGFDGTLEEWIASLQGIQGVEGQSALEVFIENFPEVTDAASMALYLKGEKGEIGVGTRIVGTLLDESELPDPATALAANEAYLIKNHLFVVVGAEWNDMGDISGPEGMGLRIKGSLSNISELPNANNVNGDTYIIARDMLVWDGTRWSEVGQVGPTGTSAYQAAVAAGFVGSESVWLASLKGDRGEKGETGETGAKGDGADALRVKGELTTEEDLPEDAVVGDSYIVRGNMFALSTGGWIDLGRFTGMNAYQLAVQEGFIGGIDAWLLSLKGTNGTNGRDGTNGDNGEDGKDGTNGTDGEDGASAYAIAVENGFVGNEAAWLYSLKGEGLEIDGTGLTEDDLPAAPAIGADALTYLIGTNLYIGKDGVWTDVGSIRGVDGRSLLEVIQEAHPEIDTADKLAVFLKGEKGDEGDQGEQGEIGPVGPSLKYRGTFADVAALNAGVVNPANADLAVVGTYHYIHDGVAWNQTIVVVGRDGVDGIDGKDGTNGTDGTNGVDGADGEDGKGLIIKGEVATVGELPAGAAVGDGYLILGNLWIKGTAGYFNAGKLRGTDGTNGLNGKSAYDTAVEAGYVGSQAEWLATMGGEDGHSAYQIAVENGFVGTEPQWLLSLKGATGGIGPMGPGVKILGVKNSSAELPASGNIAGDGYLIAGHFWGWTGTSWVDCGVIQGPAGPQGDIGIQGIKGNQGPKGERGSSIILLDHNPTALDGAVTDVAMNTVTQGLWLKSSTTSWTFIGTFGGGNVYSPATDGFQYVRSGAEWVRLNHYDLNAVATTGACDLAVSNVFKLDNSVASPKTISFLNTPAGRATTIVLLVSGKAGMFTWPSGIIWGDNTPPDLGAVLTNIVFLWDGTRLIGSVGAKA